MADDDQERERAYMVVPFGFVEVRDGDGRLLFLFDPERDLVEVRVKGRTSLVDLRKYRPALRPAQGKVI